MFSVKSGWTGEGKPVLLINGKEAREIAEKLATTLPFKVDIINIDNGVLMVSDTKRLSNFEFHDEAGEFFSPSELENEIIEILDKPFSVPK